MSAPIAEEREPSPRPGGRAAAAAAVLAAGALACGACCVLPFALPAAVLAMAGGFLAWFARAQGWVSLIAAFAVATAWAWTLAASLRRQKRPAWTTLVTLALATAVLGAALLWPRIEPAIRAVVSARV